MATLLTSANKASTFDVLGPSYDQSQEELEVEVAAWMRTLVGSTVAHNFADILAIEIRVFAVGFDTVGPVSTQGARAEVVVQVGIRRECAAS